MRIVLDTNVVISAFLTPRGAPAQLFQHFKQDAFDLLVSEPILSEYQRALNYQKVQTLHRLNKQEVATVIEDFRRAAIVIVPRQKVHPPIADKDDIKLFACAVAGEAEYIVSGDKLVQTVGEYEGIQVVSPPIFLTVLEKNL